MYFYNLDELVVEKKRISQKACKNKWQVISYETADFQGKMLCQGECAHAKPISLRLNARGWHKVYLGILPLSYQNRLAVTLGKFGKTVVDTNSWDWEPNLYIQEDFFRAVDLTDQTITIEKPTGYKPTASALAYVRIEPMTKEEIATYTSTKETSMSFHFDCDYYGECSYRTLDEVLGKLGQLEGSGGGLLFQETVFDAKPMGKARYTLPYHYDIEKRRKNAKYYIKNSVAVKRAFIEKAHEMGYSTYACYRLAMSDFVLPISELVPNVNAYTAMPNREIYTRDGRKVQALSYAYADVRTQAIEQIISSMDGCPFDGVSLIFQRGIFWGFEKPICDEVQRLYGVDARLLPYADERLQAVACSFMTSFMRVLRQTVNQKLGKQIKINVILLYSPTSSKLCGFDLETWLKENLVDNVSQGMMEWYEDLTNCLSESGLIDLDKYKSENAKREILKRTYDGDNFERIVQGAKEYQALCEQYGKEFFASLLWPNVACEKVVELAKLLQENGIKRIFSWNTNHKARNLQMMNTERNLSVAYGNGGFKIAKRKRTRVLSVGDKDISQLMQNWNG